MTDSATITVSPYDRLGGADAVARLTRAFYDLIEQDPDYAAVKAMHGEDFSGIRRAFTGFMTAWLGGPRDYFDNGGPCMMSLHAKLGIGREGAEQWIGAMDRALSSLTDVDDAFKAAMMDALSQMARGMVRS